jgi:hypothetical protein
MQEVSTKLQAAKAAAAAVGIAQVNEQWLAPERWLQPGGLGLLPHPKQLASKAMDTSTSGGPSQQQQQQQQQQQASLQMPTAFPVVNLQQPNTAGNLGSFFGAPAQQAAFSVSSRQQGPALSSAGGPSTGGFAWQEEEGPQAEASASGGGTAEDGGAGGFGGEDVQDMCDD